MKGSLTDQLMVVLECPDIPEFDPAPAIHLWNTPLATRTRRTTGYKPRTTDHDESESDYSECEMIVMDSEEDEGDSVGNVVNDSVATAGVEDDFS